MATIRKRNQKWQVQVRHVGAESTSRTFITKEDAQRWAREQELAVDRRHLSTVDRRQSFTLIDLLNEYGTAVSRMKRGCLQELATLKSLARHPIARKQVRHLTISDLARLRDDRLLCVKPSTFSRQLTLLRHALKTAHREWGWYVPSEVQALQLQLPQIITFPIVRITDETIHQVLFYADRQKSPLVGKAIRLALLTTLRRGELLGLDWSDIDLRNNTCAVRNSKNGYARTIPLHPLAKTLLSEQLDRKGKVIPLSANALKLGFNRAKKRSGVTFRFHDLRHEAISRLFEKGLTIPEVQAISGHRTLSQLSRYAHADLKQITKKLQGDEHADFVPSSAKSAEPALF